MLPPASRSKNKLSRAALLDTCFHANFLLDLFFDPEGGGDMFFRKVGWNSTVYTALYPSNPTYEVLHYVIFSIALLLPLNSIQIFPHIFYSGTFTLYLSLRHRCDRDSCPRKAGTVIVSYNSVFKLLRTRSEGKYYERNRSEHNPKFDLLVTKRTNSKSCIAFRDMLLFFHGEGLLAYPQQNSETGGLPLVLCPQLRTTSHTQRQSPEDAHFCGG
jgi:hypothetical protein